MALARTDLYYSSQVTLKEIKQKLIYILLDRNKKEHSGRGCGPCKDLEGVYLGQGRGLVLLTDRRGEGLGGGSKREGRETAAPSRGEVPAEVQQGTDPCNEAGPRFGGRRL